MVASDASHVKNKYGKNEKKVLGIAHGPAGRQLLVPVIDLVLDLDFVPSFWPVAALKAGSRPLGEPPPPSCHASRASAFAVRRITRHPPDLDLECRSNAGGWWEPQMNTDEQRWTRMAKARRESGSVRPPVRGLRREEESACGAGERTWLHPRPGQLRHAACRDAER